MSSIITWSTAKYSESIIPHETDSLFLAENVIRYLKFHTPFSIKFCLQGSLRYVAGNEEIVVPAGAFYLTNSGAELECLPNKPGVRALIVFFTDALVSDVFRSIQLDDKSLLDDPKGGIPGVRLFEQVYRSPTLLATKLQSAALCMTGSAKNDSNLVPDLFFDLAETLMCQQKDIRRRIAQVNARSTATREELFRRITKARDFMQDSWQSDLTLDTVARQVCLSPYHFHRTFREAFGISPMRWLRRLKMEKAHTLLSEKTMNVTGTALHCGFADVFSFSKAFKREWGVSPSGI